MNFLRIKQKIKIYIAIILRPNGKFSFLNSIAKNSKILDVGCGSNSAFKVKTFLPNSYYVGLDIQDYKNDHDANLYADEYILTDPNKFVDKLIFQDRKFDAILSSHNLEHCNDRYGTLNSILDLVKKGGKIYLSFPSEKSINFPNKDGCLNYYDDITHKGLPPNYRMVIEIIKKKSFIILFSSKSYKPFILHIIGFFSNILSKYTKKTTFGLWEWWGFETIIIAQKD